MASLKHVDVRTNGIRLHVVEAGPEDGPLVILLHGYPEFWYGWRSQILPLAEAGYRVWAPDQRGYNLSDKPEGVMAYHRDELARDVIGLIEAAGRQQANVIGHDWGGLVAWWLALKHPERVERLGILNVPHHAVMEATLRRSPRQLLRSWYVFYFQIPRLPELLTPLRDWRILTQTLRDTSRAGAFSDADLARYRDAWSQPGACTAMINYYRAGLRTRPPRDKRIQVPTLLIWGARDAFLGKDMAAPSIDLCDRGRLALIPEATHWVQHEEPARVNRLLLDFLAE